MNHIFLAVDGEAAETVCELQAFGPRERPHRKVHRRACCFEFGRTGTHLERLGKFSHERAIRFIENDACGGFEKVPVLWRNLIAEEDVDSAVATRHVLETHLAEQSVNPFARRFLITRYSQPQDHQIDCERAIAPQFVCAQQEPQKLHVPGIAYAQKKNWQVAR
jgi:hypothetical protein